MDQVAGAAKAAPGLRPGGQLAVFGNVFDSPPGVAKALTDDYRRVAPDAPFNAQSSRTALDIYQEMFAKAADGIATAGGFDDPEQWRFDGEQSYTRDQWLDQLPTTGTFTQVLAGQTSGGAGLRPGRHRHNRRQLHDDLHHIGSHRANQRHLS